MTVKSQTTDPAGDQFWLDCAREEGTAPAELILRSEPDADWNAIWVAMQEMGRAIAPLMELAAPPSWAVSMQFVMDVALPDVEARCAVETDDWELREASHV